MKRDGYVCQVCQGRGAFAVDHIVPKARGGTDSDANLRAICKRCHDAKTQGEAIEGRGLDTPW